ncbi:MAG: hypothetical protein KKH95_00135 [Gammaproteobacteria bacterium]|nr:hypothetical protein [Gammaproteobacteria bacterium]
MFCYTLIINQIPVAGFQPVTAESGFFVFIRPGHREGSDKGKAGCARLKPALAAQHATQGTLIDKSQLNQCLPELTGILRLIAQRLL